MGILNTTPDSFYDGGLYADADAALVHARKLLYDGADIIDIGAESTRPGAYPVSAAEESRRLIPALRLIKDAFGNALISVDTRNSVTAMQALEAGAHIINDVSAFRHDPAMLDVLVQYKPGYVLMHSQGDPLTMQNNPSYDDVVDEVAAFFETRLSALAKAGLPEDRVVLDPGIGFGKKLEHNLALMQAGKRFAELGRPLLAGVSNKSLFGELHGLDIACRREATRKAIRLMAARGYNWHRVHDIEGAKTALDGMGG